MFLDASAIIAIIARESDAAALAVRVRQASKVHTSPIAVYEAVLGLVRIGNTPIQDATALLDRFLEVAHFLVRPAERVRDFEQAVQ